MSPIFKTNLLPRATRRVRGMDSTLHACKDHWTFCSFTATHTFIRILAPSLRYSDFECKNMNCNQDCVFLRVSPSTCTFGAKIAPLATPSIAGRTVGCTACSTASILAPMGSSPHFEEKHHHQRHRELTVHAWTARYRRNAWIGVISRSEFWRRTASFLVDDNS